MRWRIEIKKYQGPTAKTNLIIAQILLVRTIKQSLASMHIITTLPCIRIKEETV